MGELRGLPAVVLVVLCTPGPDTALTVRNSLLGTRRAGIFTALGVSTGQLICIRGQHRHRGPARASEPAFQALKLVGAAYLIWLGVQTLWSVVRRRSRARASEPRRAVSPRQAWRQGVLSNLGNPKSAAFFTSLLPQFGDSFVVLLALGLLYSALTLTWLSGYAVAVARAGEVLRRERVAVSWMR